MHYHGNAIAIYFKMIQTRKNNGLLKKFLNNQSSAKLASKQQEEKLFHYNTNVTGLPFFLFLYSSVLVASSLSLSVCVNIVRFTQQDFKRKKNNECNHLLYISPLCIYLFGFVVDCFNKIQATAHIT